MARRFALSVVLGFVLLYLIMRPLARFLLFGLNVSSSTYVAVVWPALLVAAAIVIYLVAAGFDLPGRRLAWTVVVALVAAVAVCGVTVLGIQLLAQNSMWAYAEPASIAWMFLWSIELVGVAWFVSRRSEQLARA